VGDAVLDGVTTEGVAGPGWEQWRAGFTCAFDRPTAKDSDGRRGQRGDPVLAAFAVAGDVSARTCTQMYVTAGEAGQLGDPQPSLDGEQQ
jgi:hypothetical protein